MTQLSVQYSCSPTIGDYGPLTAENLAEFHLFLGNLHNQLTGLIYWTDTARVPRISTTLGTLTNPVDGLLEPTEAGGVVSIDTGVAVVNGYLYFNDVAVDFDIDGNPGNVNATDIIALRWSTATQSVRLVRLNGAAGSTAIITQSSATWEVPVVEVELDGSGQFSALVDVRQLAVSPGTVMKIQDILCDGSNDIDFVDIPPFFANLTIQLYWRAQGAAAFRPIDLQFNGDGGNNYDYLFALGQNAAMTVSAVDGGTSMLVGRATAASGAANVFDSMTVQINNYANDVGHKTVYSAGGNINTGTTATLSSTQVHGRWLSTSPITQIFLFQTPLDVPAAGSRGILYGTV